MSNERRRSTVAAVGSGVLAGLVVCVGFLLPPWLVGQGERAGDFLGNAFVLLPALWAAVSASGASFCCGSSGWTALRAALLGFFGWLLVFPLGFLVLLMVVGIFLPAVRDYVNHLNPSRWQMLITSAWVAVPGGAYFGAVVASRRLQEGSHVERIGRYDWAKVSTRCGVLGLVLFALFASGREDPPMGLGVIFLLFPALLLSTVAVVVGLWTRSALGWILGLLAWAILVIRL